MSKVLAAYFSVGGTAAKTARELAAVEGAGSRFRKAGNCDIISTNDSKDGEEGENMVILITGASHTGKTLLAQRLLEKYHYPYLSIDHLKMGLIRSGNTHLSPEDDGELLGYLWPIIREILKTAIENRQNLIVEGCYIPFDWRQDFDEQYLPSIRFVCLAMSEDYIDAHFAQIREHACDIEARLEDSDCTAERLKQENRQLIAGYRAAGEPVTILTDNYEETLYGLIQNGI